MRLSRSHFFCSSKQNFPSPEQGSFPADALMARYLERLVLISPMHSEFLVLLMQYVDPDRMAEALEELVFAHGDEVFFEKLNRCGDGHDLVRWLESYLGLVANTPLEHEVRSCVQAALHNGLPDLPGEQSGYAARIRHLKKLLGLNCEQVRVLELCVCYKCCRSFESYCDQYQVSDWIPLVAAALQLPLRTASRCLVGKGSLQDKRLIKFQPMGMDVLEPLYRYLLGLSDDFLDEEMFAVSSGPAFPMDSFPLEPVQIDLLRKTVTAPGLCHLLFYGRPGTGKTELARTLAVEAGLKPFVVRAGGDGHGQERRVALCATLSVAPSDALVIIDEADGLLNNEMGFFSSPRKVDKGWINQFMDECPLKTIWISNEWAGIPTSTLRRFSYSMEFRKFSPVQRRSAWELQVKHHHLDHLISSGMINRLALAYQVDAGGIGSALRTASGLARNGSLDGKNLEQMLGELLGHHEQLSGASRRRKRLVPVQTQYDVDALNTDVPVERMLNGLENRNQAIQAGENPFPAALLFWGQPGTGKTEFAKHLAQKLGRGLVLKRVSDLQSKWVGETEQKIAAAFAEAEAEGAVLLLDEADSLFLDRRSAERSWEASQTNELLTQMENFTGICICCTNLLDHLDDAALRRFTWKVEFRPLAAEGRERLFVSYFLPSGGLSHEVRAGLKELCSLTPGDFKVVAQQARFAGAPLSPEDALEALKRETQYKRGTGTPLGFCA